MSAEELEARARKLTPADRAELAAKLLRSLETPSEEEIEQLWADEALHRHQEWEARGKGPSAVKEQRPSEFGDLGPSEKLRLVEALWDDLASTPNDVPVQQWQIEELERRKANLVRNPESGLSWEEVWERVLRRIGG